jgi:uncharacterized membrane protein
MSRRLQENIAALVILGVFVAVIVIGQNYGPRARLVPTVIAWFGVAMIGVQLVLQNTRLGDALEIDLLDVISARATGDEDGLPPELRSGFDEALGRDKTAKPPQNRAMRELGAMGIVAIAVAMFVVIGPVPTMLAFTFGYFVISGHFDVWRAALYALVFATAVYLLFYVWLRVNISKSVFDLGFGLW